MKKVAIIGHRGLVGSELMRRIGEEKDYEDCHSITLFSQGLSGKQNNVYPFCNQLIENSKDTTKLLEHEIIVSCQGSSYSHEIYPKLIQMNWNGYWIDASSAFRLDNDACLVLDPLNLKSIEDSIDKGVKKFIGPNCTVSLMLMALQGAFEEELVESVISHTYQAISGAGAKAINKLLSDYELLAKTSDNFCVDHNFGDEFQGPSLNSVLNKIETIHRRLLSDPKLAKKTSDEDPSLAYSLNPWIDCAMTSGQTKEEWKAQVEAQKILSNDNILIDGTCVRVPVLRCHSQALTLKLKRSVDIKTVCEILGNASSWVKVIDNNEDKTKKYLNPQFVASSLDILIGRVRKSLLGDDIINLFTVGDQLLWGAAEPLRRVLKLLLKN